MIIVRLQGGLGNQMFQYAIGRRLALYYNTILKLDTNIYASNIMEIDMANFNDNSSSTEKTTPRGYELDNFYIQAEIATVRDIYIFRSQKNWFPRAKKFLTKSRYITETNFHFNPAYLQFGKNCYLNGYWQSEQYFAEIADTIRNEFKYKSAFWDDANLKMAALIQSKNAVSIHVRRGDYINNPSAFEFHGVCTISYYQRAIDIVVRKVQSPHFFIFSDDIDWVQKNFIINHPATIVNLNNNSGCNDLRLMSACKHHIIANSSFSWWGAWLNNYPNKIVVGPKKWFNNPSIDTSTVLPDNWNKL